MKCPKCNNNLEFIEISDDIVIDMTYHETERYECPACGFRAKKDIYYKLEYVGCNWKEEES